MADEGSGDALTDVVAELYGLPPEDFTVARNDRAKQAKTAGDKELAAAIGKLRKPSAAAWALNQMVRHHADEIDQFLAVGAALREAQADLDPDQLKALGRQRHQVVAAVARQARALARELGNPVSATVEGEVEQTLRAALADPDAAAAVSGGQLTKTLDYAGLGDTKVDLTGAVAAPGSSGRVVGGSRASSSSSPSPASASASKAPAPDAAEKARAELEKAEADAAEAERVATEAQGFLDEADARVTDLESQKYDLDERLAELEEQAQQARTDLSRVGREARNAARDRDRAARHAESTRQQADKARARAARLG